MTFFDTQNIFFEIEKRFFFESLDELKMKLISMLHNILKGFNFLQYRIEIFISEYSIELENDRLNPKLHLVFCSNHQHDKSL